MRERRGGRTEGGGCERESGEARMGGGGERGERHIALTRVGTSIGPLADLRLDELAVLVVQILTPYSIRRQGASCGRDPAPAARRQALP